jgi:hypothetical protein
VNITAEHLKILVALRDAAALQRKPADGVLDGHQHRFSLGQLEREERLSITADTSAAARSLRRHTEYVTGSTMHMVVYYALTDAGLGFVARLEEQAGVTGLAAAELALEQAERDMHAAIGRYHEARRVHTAARREAGVRGSVNVLLDAMKETVR